MYYLGGNAPTVNHSDSKALVPFSKMKPSFAVRTTLFDLLGAIASFKDTSTFTRLLASTLLNNFWIVANAIGLALISTCGIIELEASWAFAVIANCLDNQIQQILKY